MGKSVEIVVPCFNPSVGWATDLVANFLIFKQLATPLHLEKLGLTIVNDGSTHGFGEAEKQFLEINLPDAQLIFYPKNRGKGFALRAGVAASKADFWLLTDADFPYKMESMVAILEKTMRCGGLVAGFREPNYYEKVPFSRRILSKALRWILENGLRLPTSDSQCGLKCLDKTGKIVFLKTQINRFLFDLELLVLANKTPQLNVSTVAVELRDGVKFSKVSLRILFTEMFNFVNILWMNH